MSGLARVLVVDDDSASREILVARLTAHGYDVQADRGDTALAMAREQAPDVVLLDVMLPGIDGLQVCRALKSDPQLPFLPIILVTARSDSRDVVAGLEAGGDEYLTKPVDPAALLARVHSMLRIKALHDTVRNQATQLRRFLSPQVVDLVAADGQGGEDLLKSHRREITIVAARLSGLTTLSETAAPEDVMAVLHEFHAAMGELIVQFNGTLERFTSDGLKVFFNDPVPCPDPALQGIRLAIAMRARSEKLLAGWRQRGHTLSFSAAVATGYATLGVIGFSARSDYGAVGLVSDLVTWLCRESPAGQVLITQRVLGGIDAVVEAEPLGELRPPEFLRGVSVFRLVGLKERAAPADRGSPLSPREHEVALLVSEGLTNRQIADQLVVTEATAAKHVENILNKLGFNSRAQIASWMAVRR